MSNEYPLSDIGLAVSKFKCFGKKPGGFPSFQPINIIIGRNNTGKSALIDAVELCISKGSSFDQTKLSRSDGSFTVYIDQKIDEILLQKVFPQGTSGGGVPGPDHWQYGQKYIGQTILRSFGPDWNANFNKGPNFDDISEASRQQYLQNLANFAPWPFDGLHLLKVGAERDVRPESHNQSRTLNSNGIGATNLVRAFITSDDLPREKVEIELLDDLNVIYQGDCQFTRIICQEDANGVWELFLREEKKGDIRLSQSGSSLKSIFIILCMLRLVPIIDNLKLEKTVLAIEEPENNLHPALLRRLLNFLSDQRDKNAFTLIITTHSPIGIDWSTRRSDSQVIHVRHDGQEARTRTAIKYHQNREIIEDLDIRASDILQANCVIWVEGPSDRIYLCRWLDLRSEGQLKEGVHYTIMFYGGKLLSHLDALPPDEGGDLISLLSINRNAAVVIDSDRHLGGTGKKKPRKPRMNLNATKKRIKAELEKIDGFVWVTEGREMENYTPISVFARVAVKPVPKNVDQYTQVTKLPFLKEFKEVKVSIAHAVAPNTEEADLINHMDVWSKLAELCSHIKRWNGLSR